MMEMKIYIVHKGPNICHPDTGTHIRHKHDTVTSLSVQLC